MFTESVVRRLTPLECERLQGFPDGWTDALPPSASSRFPGHSLYSNSPLTTCSFRQTAHGWTDIGPWTDSAGKLHKESSDSARYKALGNSIALPPWAWVLKRLCACYERDATGCSSA